MADDRGILRFHGGSVCWFVEVPVLGPVILAASRSDRMRRLISAAPVTKRVVDRFIPGETVDEIVPIVRELTDRGLELTMDVVGEDITTPEQAEAARDAYLALVDRLRTLDLGTRAEMSVKLSMFGQALPGGTSWPSRTSGRSSRRPPPSVRPSRSTPRTTPPSTRCSPSTRNCGRTSPRPAV